MRYAEVVYMVMCTFLCEMCAEKSCLWYCSDRFKLMDLALLVVLLFHVFNRIYCGKYCRVSRALRYIG